MLIGNIAEGNKRLYNFEWQHSAQDAAATVRDFLKWDDQPTGLQNFAESAARAYKITMTPPMGPVLLSLDQFMQEGPIPGVHGEGPITDPKDLAPAISRALAAVQRGEPALVDVHTDPR